MQLVNDKVGVNYMFNARTIIIENNLKFLLNYDTGEFITSHASDQMPLLWRYQKTIAHIKCIIYNTWANHYCHYYYLPPSEAPDIGELPRMEIWSSWDQKNRTINPDAILRTVKSKQPITLYNKKMNKCHLPPEYQNKVHYINKRLTIKYKGYKEKLMKNRWTKLIPLS